MLDTYWDSFEDDFTLGKLPKKEILRPVLKTKTNQSGTRLVVLSGTFNFNQSLSFGDTAQLQVDLKNFLTSNGYGIASIKMSHSYFRSVETPTLEIGVQTLNSQTAEQIRQIMTNAIGQYKRWWVTGEFSVMTDIDLKVVSDYKTTTTTKEIAQKEEANSFPSLPKIGRKISKVAENAAAATGTAALETIKDSATGLFTNMGYTLPIAGLVGIVILIIVLKK